VLSRTPDVLDRIVAEHAPGQLKARPFEGKWTPNEIIGHLTDAEWAFGYRARQVLGDQGAVLSGFDQDGWVAAQKHNDRDPVELVEMFRQLRRWNLAAWARLVPADLDRVGHRASGESMSLGQLLVHFAGHDLHHLDQLTRYLDAVKTSA
jgi:uncharacterized damage-inducible protein DinB